MRYILILIGIAATSWCSAQQISFGEYFFDTDPGYGNATEFTFAPGSNINLTQNLPITHLSNGYHTIYYRFKNDENKWGTTSNKSFYKSGGIEKQIKSGEYFIDSDPGYGKATSFSFTPEQEINFTEKISASNLSDGFHSLYYRLKDNSGNWGTTSIHPFYKDLSPQIIKLHYQIDNNSTITISIQPGVNVLDFTLNHDIQDLESGEHEIKFWVENENGINSTIWSETFERTETGVDGENVNIPVKTYPNPATNFLNIKSECNVIQVKVYNIRGTLVLQDNSGNHQIDLQNIPTGTYIVSIKTMNDIVVKTIIKN